MNSSPEHDPLIALWQTAPTPDTHRLLQDLQRLNRLHQRLYRSVLAIMCGIALLLIFEEATGRVASHGVLSAIWILGLAVGVVRRRRAVSKRCHALTSDTVSLLKLMIARAKSDLFVARCLYAGVPCGAAAGYVASDLLGIGGVTAASPYLHMIQTGAGIAALIIMMVAGAVLARSRRFQVRELSDRLRSIQTDV